MSLNNIFLFRYKRLIVRLFISFNISLFYLLFSESFFCINTGTVYAGGITSSCEDIIVFTGGNVNNYVKQFSGVTDPDLPLDKAGKMLALLVQLDGLYSQIGYGSLGYVYIQADPRDDECSNEKIRKRIMGEVCCRNADLMEGRGMILLSGQFQKVRDQIYLLTSLEFVRKGVDETVRIPFGSGRINESSFIALLPFSAVSFAPRKFTEQQLYEVANAYTDVMYVREKPNISSNPKIIEPFDIDGFSYYVEEIKKDWLKIKSYKYGLPSGWVKIPQDIGGLGLRDLLPELYFMDATALYLQTRISGRDFSPEKYTRYLKKFEKLMREFEEKTKSTSDQYAVGLLNSMYAILLLERPGPILTRPEINQISALTSVAASLLPTSNEAKSMAALTRFAVQVRSGEISLSDAGLSLEKYLLNILSTDPSNIYIKANLVQLGEMNIAIDKSNLEYSHKITALRERFRKDTRVLKLIR